MYAGRNTAEDLLGSWQHVAEGEEEDEESLDAETFRSLTSTERAKLQAFVDALEANQERDPKYDVVRDTLVSKGWLNEGCIIFSQYFDSIWWLAHQLSEDMPDEIIGIYAVAPRSGILVHGTFSRKAREDLKQMVRRGELRLLLGTDAASEGLNLQRLGTLMNLDLPWNPTRLEQRKGRIQRIGQLRDKVLVYNMRYKDSVEDRVHQLLSDRLEGIFRLFGQLPDVLEDVWIDVAMGQIEQAKMTIDALCLGSILSRSNTGQCRKPLGSLARWCWTLWTGNNISYEVGGKPPNQSGNSSQIFRRTYGYPLQASVDASMFDERTIAVSWARGDRNPGRGAL
jgi:hypothetical protein